MCFKSHLPPTQAATCAKSAGLSTATLIPFAKKGRVWHHCCFYELKLIMIISLELLWQRVKTLYPIRYIMISPENQAFAYTVCKLMHTELPLHNENWVCFFGQKTALYIKSDLIFIPLHSKVMRYLYTASKGTGQMLALHAKHFIRSAIPIHGPPRIPFRRFQGSLVLLWSYYLIAGEKNWAHGKRRILYKSLFHRSVSDKGREKCQSWHACLEIHGDASTFNQDTGFQITILWKPALGFIGS